LPAKEIYSPSSAHHQQESYQYLSGDQATGNDLLQTPHDVWIALHCSFVGSVDGCLCGDVGDKLELRAQVDVLKFL
jgi:hypothetical protein